MSRQKIDIKKPQKTEKVLINSKQATTGGASPNSPTSSNASGGVEISSTKSTASSSASVSPEKALKQRTKASFRQNGGLFSRLPPERVISILVFLDPQSVCRFGITSFAMRVLSEDNNAWKYRLKPPERSEQNGSKEHVDIPAKVQYMRAFSQWSLWAHCGVASKFMRNWSSQSSLSAIVQVLNRPLRENNPMRKLFAERVLENEIIQMLQEDDEWKPPVIGCVAIILLGIYGRAKDFPNLIPTVWRLLLETEVGDKIVPKLVVAAFFADTNFKENALDFVKQSVKFIGESSSGTTEEEEEEEKHPVDTKSSKHKARRVSNTLSKVGALDLKNSNSHMAPPTLTGSCSAASQSDVSVRMRKKPHNRRPSVKYVDVFCLQCAVLTVVEMLREKGAISNAKKLLPPDIMSLAEHHAYNRTAKAAKEWCQTIKENNTKLGLGTSKCAIL